MSVRSALASCSVLLVVSLLGCYGADGAADGTSPQAATEARACVAGPKLSASELASPAIDFEADVVPILVASCSFSACHASHGSSNHGVFLSAKSADDMKTVKAALHGKSHALTTMPYVTAGDPDNSFLMHKLDGDQCTLEERCEGRSCGDSMPDGNDLLPEATRNVVRRWIAQGAK